MSDPIRQFAKNFRAKVRQNPSNSMRREAMYRAWKKRQNQNALKLKLFNKFQFEITTHHINPPYPLDWYYGSSYLPSYGAPVVRELFNTWLNGHRNAFNSANTNAQRQRVFNNFSREFPSKLKGLLNSHYEIKKNRSK